MTLLEAVLALAILSSVLIVCLELRARMLRHTEALQRSQMVERETSNLILMASAGLLPDPVRDERAGAFVWKGDHLGHPFTITAAPVALPSPVKTGTEEAGVRMWKYRLAYLDQTTEVILH